MKKLRKFYPRIHQSRITLKKGIDKATEFLVGKIQENSKPISDSNAIAQCGTIAAGNDDEVGQMIANAMDKVGKEGIKAIISMAGGIPAINYEKGTTATNFFEGIMYTAEFRLGYEVGYNGYKTIKNYLNKED